MADISDVVTTLVDMISAMVYPTGTTDPSIIGADIMVYGGWPQPEQLDKDLAEGKCHINVFPRPEERNVTRHINTNKEIITGPDTGISIREVKRQEQVIQIGVWAGDPSIRDQVCKVIDPLLADATRFVLPDQTYARMVYRNAFTEDQLQKAMLYRRLIFYVVEYATTITSTGYVIKENNIDITAQQIPL